MQELQLYTLFTQCMQIDAFSRHGSVYITLLGLSLLTKWCFAKIFNLILTFIIWRQLIRINDAASCGISRLLRLILITTFQMKYKLKMKPQEWRCNLKIKTFITDFITEKKDWRTSSKSISIHMLETSNLTDKKLRKELKNFIMGIYFHHTSVLFQVISLQCSL